MPKRMEEILGLGPIDTKRKIPGTIYTKEREFRYVSCKNHSDVDILFREVVRKVNPPLAKNGGVVNEGCVVTLPSGECYFALSYKGDLDGWRQQIEQGALELGLTAAKIYQEKLLPSDGSECFLSDCDFKFN